MLFNLKKEENSVIDDTSAELIEGSQAQKDKCHMITHAWNLKLEEVKLLVVEDAVVVTRGWRVMEKGEILVIGSTLPVLTYVHSGSIIH